MPLRLTVSYCFGIKSILVGNILLVSKCLLLVYRFLAFSIVFVSGVLLFVIFLLQGPLVINRILRGWLSCCPAV